MSEVQTTLPFDEPAQPFEGRRLGAVRRRADTVAQSRPALETSLALVVADLAALAVATVAALVGLSLLGLVPDGAPAASDAPLLIACGVAVQLYRPFGLDDIQRFAIRCRAVLLFGALSLLFWALFGSIGEVVLFVVVQSGLLLVLGFYLDLLVRERLIRSWIGPVPAVVIGEGPAARDVVRELEQSKRYGLAVIGVGTAGDLEREDFAAIVKGADVAIFCEARPKVACSCDGKCVLIADVDEGAQGSLVLKPAQRDDGRGYLWFKRALDLAVAVPATILTAPIIGAVALWVKWVDPGRAIYVQERVCAGGKIRPIFKIRSMYLDSEARLEAHLAEHPEARAEWQRHFKLRDDPRVLPTVGQFIRSSSIDELPQLWNIVLGDMSLVGPRPFPVYHLSSFEKSFQALRSSVQPGLTGYWQVMSRSSGDLEQQQSQDTYYIENRSTLLDLYILLKTVPAVISGKGAH